MTHFYVSVIDGKKHGLLLGPYPTKEEAEGQVERGRKLANDADPWAHFYAFGTCWMMVERKTCFGK